MPFYTGAEPQLAIVGGCHSGVGGNHHVYPSSTHQSLVNNKLTQYSQMYSFKKFAGSAETVYCNHAD